jgi:hypothetical protein
MCEGLVTRSHATKYRKSMAQTLVMQKTLKEEQCYPICVQNIDNQEQVEVKKPHEEENIKVVTYPVAHTPDVEEIDLNGATTHSETNVSGNVVVDYEEDEMEATKYLEKVKSTTSCAPDACRTMNGNQLALLSTAMRDENGQNTTRIRRISRRKSSSSERFNSINIVTNGDGSIVFNRKEKGSNSHIGKEDMKAISIVESMESILERCSKIHKLCLCEVRLHQSMESCWLVANGNVYDVTGVVSVHPAGPNSILRKAGGPDCTQDMKFHSKMARKILHKCFIGKLQPCGPSIQDENKYQASCTIM